METVKINMVPKGAVKAAHASQGDAPRVVRFELFDELLPYTLDGSEDITLKVVRPDTEEIVSSVTNTEEAYIDVSFTSEMTALRGVANCEIKISKSGAEIGSHNFDLNIERDAYGENITVETVSGVIATFTTGVIDNLVGLKTTFEPKQDLHGYETPWIDSNVVNKAPYLSRALAGTASRIGNYEFNKLVGGTYAFNQLVKWKNTTVQGISANISADGTVELSGISTGNYTNITENTDPIDNHIYYFGKTVISNPNNIIFSWSFLNVNMGPATPMAASQYQVRKCVNHTGAYTGLSGFDANTDFTGVKVKIICIDLTQMFGSTIADYIYSLETAQAGAGVSFFKALFDKDYYPYNAGELISVKTSAHVTKDANNNVISNIALDPDLELRGIPKLDENNNLYYDGDTYESNGDVTRRYGIVDLGSLTWYYQPVGQWSSAIGSFYASVTDLKVGQSDRIENLIASKFYITGSSQMIYSGNDMVISNNSGLIRISNNNYSDATTFKNAMSGVYLVYEKATPTTESADPFTDPQEIDASGSEEFIDARAVSIPVGHESYYANICEIEGIDEITFYHSGEDTQDPESALVEIGQEVYGGYYDKDLGIVLTQKIKVYDGSENWSLDAPSKPWLFSVPAPSDIKQGNASSLYVFSDMFVATDNIWSISGYGILNNYTGLKVGYPTADGDVSILKSLLNKKSLTVCYQLETPIIIPADAVNFETVKGVNNVWSDTNGETEVKFFVKEA